MEQPFLLTLPVQQLSRPDGFPDLTQYEVRVTLRHTIGHIKHSIWLFSAEQSLKPVFLSFLFHSNPVSDSSPLSEILRIMDPADLGPFHGLALTIDYTLMESALIPARDPIPDLFDVEIKPEMDLHGSKCFTRESLLSSVGSIREFACEKYKVAIAEIDLSFGDFVFSPEKNLRQALGLDVPPLSTVKITIWKKPLRTSLQGVSHGYESKAKLVVRDEDHSEDEDSGFDTSKNETLNSINKTQTETEYERSCSLPSETYELSVDGNSVVLSTSECIFDPQGFLLLNPHALSRLASLGISLNDSVINRGVSVVGHQGAVVDPNLQNREIQRSNEHLDSDHESNFHSQMLFTPAEIAQSGTSEVEIPDHTAEGMQNTAAETHRNEPEIEQIDIQHAPEPQIQPPRPEINVMTRLINIVYENRNTIFQSVLQIGITMFLTGRDIFLELFEKRILFVMAATSTFISLFVFGAHVGDWIDDNVLRNGDENSLDYAILKFVAVLFKSAFRFNTRLSTAFSGRGMRLTALLHQSRLELLQDEILGNPVFSTVKRLCFQVLLFTVMCIATMLPFMEFDMASHFHELHKNEGRVLKTEVRDMYSKLKSEDLRPLIQAQIKIPIEVLLDTDKDSGSGYRSMVSGNRGNENDESDESSTWSEARIQENEDLLRCYLSLKWLERHPQASVLPRRLRRG